MPRSRRGYENDSGAGMLREDPLTCPMPLPIPFPLPIFSSFELDSPATLANISSASDGFCRLEKGSSSVLEDSDRGAWSSSPNGCTTGSCDHVVPRLPNVWKLPSGAVAVSDGNDCWVCPSDCSCDSSTRFFFRSRRPPRLLPPSTQSRLSRLQRRHGMELSESLCDTVRFQMPVSVVRKPQTPTRARFRSATRATKHGRSVTYSKHRLFLFLQFKHAICVLLAFAASSSSGLVTACAPAGCCGAFVSISQHCSDRQCRCLKLSGIVGTTRRGETLASGIADCRAEVTRWESE